MKSQEIKSDKDSHLFQQVTVQLRVELGLKMVDSFENSADQHAPYLRVHGKPRQYKR